MISSFPLSSKLTLTLFLQSAHVYVKLYLFVEFSLLNASSFYIMSLLDCISHYIQ